MNIEKEEYNTFESVKEKILTQIQKRGDLFFEHGWDFLHDPLLIKDITRSIKRIKQAIDQKEKIMVYGDFDSDGITSTVLLVSVLRKLGGIVSYRIPNRDKDSHGLKESILEEIISKEVSLIITCDCGINDYKEVEFATNRGVEVIITDHHSPDPQRHPASAFAVINPHQELCNYPEKNLAGVGVVFKLLEALVRDIKKDEQKTRELLNPYLELVAIGLVADCMILQGEVRVLVKMGLERMKNSSWKALQLLLKNEEVIDEQTIGFTIGPRLNSASRLGDVYTAVELFLDPQGTETRLDYLENLNVERKKLTQKGVQEARKKIERKQQILFISSSEWRIGILGLIAGKLSEETGKPVICGREEGTVIKASCRAPLGFDMITCLRSFDDNFTQYGGHEGAAGLMMNKDKKDSLSRDLKKYGEENTIIQKERKIDFYLENTDFLPDIAHFFETLKPFGIGNKPFVFGIKEAQIIQKKFLGKTKEHMTVCIEHKQNFINLSAFFLGHRYHELKMGKPFTFYFTISLNTFRGKQRVQIRLEDFEQN